MKYEILSENIEEVSESMKVLTKDKFSRIESRLADSESELNKARVVLNTAPNDKFEVKVVANLNNREYFTEEVSFSLEHALVSCVTELVGMMERVREKDWDTVRDAKTEIVDEILADNS